MGKGESVGSATASTPESGIMACTLSFVHSRLGRHLHRASLCASAARAWSYWRYATRQRSALRADSAGGYVLEFSCLQPRVFSLHMLR